MAKRAPFRTHLLRRLEKFSTWKGSVSVLRGFTDLGRIRLQRKLLDAVSGYLPMPDNMQEEEIEQIKIEARPRAVRGQSAREPKKTLKANGNGLSHSVGSATPSGAAQSEDLSPSSKKKRKSRKKYLVSRSSIACLFKMLISLVSRNCGIR